ncbi:MAG: lytic murein transglycosylase [bacterium]
MGKKAIVFVFILLFSLNIFVNKARAIFDCETLNTASSQIDKDFCQNELNALMKEQADLEATLKVQQKQTGTLKGDVAALTTQINALKIKIKARGLVIAQLKVNIAEKVSTIQSLSEKIDREHESLAQLLRNTNEFDNNNLVNLVLSNDSISNFYSDLESYNSIKQAIKDSVDIINGIKTQTEAAKQDLQKKQDAEIDAKAELESAQKTVVKSEAEKKQLLAISKNKEAEYQKLAAQKKAKADKIRAALFPLRDSQAIPFGTALLYAENAQKKTGVRSAFVLAILQQESNMGADVGSCVITNLSTGETKGINYGTVFPNGIHPTRDLPFLQSIVEELGRNPLTTRVSCPLASGGYGGAIGPTQFLPSTWNGIKQKIANALGKNLPDPWIPEDAIMASSIYLSELGAGAGGYTAERTAALKYYAGSNWNKKANAFYGNQVMQRVTTIQSNIDLLSG